MQFGNVTHFPIFFSYRLRQYALLCIVSLQVVFSHFRDDLQVIYPVVLLKRISSFFFSKISANPKAGRPYT